MRILIFIEPHSFTTLNHMFAPFITITRTPIHSWKKISQPTIPSFVLSPNPLPLDKLPHYHTTFIKASS